MLRQRGNKAGINDRRGIGPAGPEIGIMVIILAGSSYEVLVSVLVYVLYLYCLDFMEVQDATWRQ